MVSQLNQQQAADVEDIITSSPEQELFERLNAVLVRRLSTSRKQRLRQLLSHEEMGDREVWILDPDVLEEFLRTIWPSPFRTHVQGILAVQTISSVISATYLADRISKVTRLPTTASITTSSSDNTIGLLEGIEELSR